ncbi:protein kinase domain-containing protein [Streptomyces sp. E-08]|uniref:protein kinase domain-containing protein n=1 Tax=Streptomyces sp. E-08 TaxID=3404047 RepID=UPI003CE8A894
MRADWLPGTTVLKEFTVERVLGAGGYGHVALVRSLRSGEPYAAKRLHSDDLAQQGHLIAEAQRWIMLPTHPHITQCRFTRTVGDQLVVFSEFVPGGSLAERIRSGRLYDDDAAATLRRILVVAAQVAYGLDAAHATGLLHLDVKPDNILFGEDDTAKLTDFGLADIPQESMRVRTELRLVVDHIVDDARVDSKQIRAMKAALSEKLMPEYQQLPGLTAPRPQGHSPAYASPEQCDGLPVGPAADVWSWALTLLEMLVGERTWPNGAVAPFVLQEDCRTRMTANSVDIPVSLAELMEACFHEEPRARPASLRRLAARIRDIAEQETGPWTAGDAPPRPSLMSSLRMQADARRSVDGATLQDPAGFLRYAYTTAGLDESETVAYWPSGSGNHKARLLEDLRGLSEAWRVLADIPDGARPDLGIMRARCAAGMGEVQSALGDLAGAIEHYRTSVRVLETLPETESREDLPRILNGLAILLRRDGEVEESLRVADQAIEASKALNDGTEANGVLGMALMTKANTLVATTTDAAESLYAASLRACHGAGREELEAKVVANLAICLEAKGASDRAAELWGRGDRMLAAFDPTDRPDLQAVRASLWLQRAELAPGDSDAVCQYALRAAKLLAPVVRAGLHSYAGEMGRAFFLLGWCAEREERIHKALSGYRQASRLLVAAVLRDGRSELTSQLAQSYSNEATLIGTVEGAESAVHPARRAVDIWRLAVDGEGVGERGRGLAEALLTLAQILQDLGRLDESDSCTEEGLRIVEDSRYRVAGGGAVTKARLYRNRAVVHRRRGRLDEALRWCRGALGALPDAEDRPEVRTRILTLQTIGIIHTDRGAFRSAWEVCEATTAVIEHYVRSGVLAAPDLADGLHRVATSRIRYGLGEEGAEAARMALSVYEKLVAQGRTDLRLETARTRTALASALTRIGALEDAALEWEKGIQAYRELPDSDVALEVATREESGPGLGGVGEEPPNPSGAQWRDRLVHRFSERLADLRRTLESSPDDMKDHLAWHESVHSTAAALAAAGHPEEASALLEINGGEVAWLARKFPSDEVEWLRGRSGQLLGLYSLQCGRGGAAVRGFRTAVDSFRILRWERERDEFAEPWLEAYIGWAAARAAEGDDSGAEAVVQEMRQRAGRIRPLQAPAWDRRTAETLRFVRERRG